MGDIELRGRKRARKRNLKDILLRSVAAAGLIGLAIAAPNVVGALHKFGLTPSVHNQGNLARTRKKLLKDGLLAYDGSFLRLTPKGAQVLHVRQVHEAARTRPRKWDGRWRVLIFDIPEYRKGLRNKVRRTIRAVGFTQLQKSVWVYPFDCEDLIMLLKADFKIGKDMLYMIVDELEYDRPLRERFRLPADR